MKRSRIGSLPPGSIVPLAATATLAQIEKIFTFEFWETDGRKPEMAGDCIAFAKALRKRSDIFPSVIVDKVRCFIPGDVNCWEAVSWRLGLVENVMDLPEFEDHPESWEWFTNEIYALLLAEDYLIDIKACKSIKDYNIEDWPYLEGAFASLDFAISDMRERFPRLRIPVYDGLADLLRQVRSKKGFFGKLYPKGYNYHQALALAAIQYVGDGLRDRQYIGTSATKTPQIGARNPTKEDASIPAERLRELAKKQPISVLNNLNCPPDLFRELAATHPLTAMNSPAIKLLLLENAGFWTQLELEFAERWIQRLWHRLKTNEQRVAIRAFIEERLLLHLNPETASAQEIETSLGYDRSFLEGKISFETLNAKKDEQINHVWGMLPRQAQTMSVVYVNSYSNASRLMSHLYQDLSKPSVAHFITNLLHSMNEPWLGMNRQQEAVLIFRYLTKLLGAKSVIGALPHRKNKGKQMVPHLSNKHQVAGISELARLRTMVSKFADLLPKKQCAHFLINCISPLLPLYEKSVVDGSPRVIQPRRALEFIEDCLSNSSELMGDQLFAAGSLIQKAKQGNDPSYIVPPTTAATRVVEAIDILCRQLKELNLGGKVRIRSIEVLDQLEFASRYARRDPEAMYKRQLNLLLPYLKLRAGDLLTSGFPSTLPTLEGTPLERNLAALVQNATHDFIEWLDTGVESELDFDILSRVRDGFQEVTKAKSWVDAFITEPAEYERNVWRFAVYNSTQPIWESWRLSTTWVVLRNMPRDEIGRKKKKSSMVVAGVESSGHMQQMKICAEKLRAMYSKMIPKNREPQVWACKDIWQKADGTQLWRDFFTHAGCIFDDVSTGSNRFDSLAKKYSAGLKKIATLKVFDNIIPKPRNSYEYAWWDFDNYTDGLDNVIWGLDTLLRREVTDIELLMYFSPWQTLMTIDLGDMLTTLITEIKGSGRRNMRTSFVDQSDVKPLELYASQLTEQEAKK